MFHLLYFSLFFFSALLIDAVFIRISSILYPFSEENQTKTHSGDLR